MKPYGDVVSANSAGFYAVLFDDVDPPLLGEPVVVGVGKISVVGVVCYVSLGPQSGLSVSPAGESWEAFTERYPEIRSLVERRFFAANVGYLKEGRFFPSVPPAVPRVHDSVHPACEEVLKKLSANLSFLKGVPRNLREVPPEEVVASAVAFIAEREKIGPHRLYRNLGEVFHGEVEFLTKVLDALSRKGL